MHLSHVIGLSAVLFTAMGAGAPVISPTLSEAAKKRLIMLAEEIPTVPDEYLVHLQPNYTLDQHLSFLGVEQNTTDARFEPLTHLNAHFGYYGTDMLHKVLEDPGVKMVEMNEIGWLPDQDHNIRYGDSTDENGQPTNTSNTKREVPPERNAPWHLHQLSEKFKGEPGSEFRVHPEALGQGVEIYIMDTGIQKVGKVHMTDSRVAVEAKDFSGHEDPSDHVGHGTGVAALALGSTVGVAKAAMLVSAKVCHKFDGCTAFNSVKAMDWILDREGKKPDGQKGKAVVNMSIQNKAEHHGLGELINKGYGEHNLIFFAAAGNIPSGSAPNAEDNFPCGFTLVNCVGATNRDYTKWQGSSHGPKVIFAAPGVWVKTAWPVDEDDPSKGQTFEIRRGTSFSSPLAAGVAAMFISHECFLTPMQPFVRLMQNGVKGISPGWSKKQDPNKIFINTGYWKGGNEGDPYYMPQLNPHC